MNSKEEIFIRLKKDGWQIIGVALGALLAWIFDKNGTLKGCIFLLLSYYPYLILFKKK